MSGKQIFSHLSVFCKRILAMGGLVPISSRFGRVALQPDGAFMTTIATLPGGFRRREKVFGHGGGQPLDRNAKARIMVYARAWSARHKRPGQHRGPLTRATLEVLEALLWGFHNSRDGRCFPSYETIAKRAQCCRDTVYEAIRALEAAEILTWVNRLIRVQFRELDLFGKMALRSRLIRTSNAYIFRDPLPCASAPQARGEGVMGAGQSREGQAASAVSFASSAKSENPPRTQTQDFSSLSIDPTQPKDGLSDALSRLKTAMMAKEQSQMR
ncbi:MAG: helix-turn-helix domain-containing protein [Acidocella sp.]|nr:helix-turn-helix domain-containing protein [Acidocella sp.]